MSDQQKAEVWRRKAVRRAIRISRLEGTIQAVTDLAGEEITDRGEWGAGYQACITDLREVLTEFGHLPAGDTEQRAIQLEGLLGIANETSNRSEAERARYEKEAVAATQHVLELKAELADAQVALASVREAAAWIRRNYPALTHANDRLAAALDEPPAHDAGPTVAEAAADDRAYWECRDAGEGP